jgi:DtxR family transcriptional regulator, Mn-dependent transcriptional regulator
MQHLGIAAFSIGDLTNQTYLWYINLSEEVTPMDPKSRNAAHHYLVAISDLRDRLGYARVTDLARHLELTPGSVSITLKSLERKGLVTRDPNGFALLTPTGLEVARTTRVKNQRLRHFFQDLLGVPSETAADDSRKIDHLISRESVHRVCALMRFIDSGHPAAQRFVAEFRRPRRNAETADRCDACPEQCFLTAPSP